MRGLSDCLFTIHQPDVNALKMRLIKEGKSDEEVKQLSHSYFRDRYQQSNCQASIANSCMCWVAFVNMI